MKEYFAKLKYLFRWRDFFFTVLLFTIILTIAFCRAESMMEVTFGEAAVDIHTSRYHMNIPYDLVESVEMGLIDEDDELVSGVSDLALRTGTWSNREWGEYTACMDVQTSKCVLVRLKDGRLFVFSHQSDDQVRQDYETLLSHVN